MKNKKLAMIRKKTNPIKDLYNQDYYLEISVIDTGIGIKDEDKHNIFEMFGQLEDHKKLNENGIGLGLLISQQIAIRLGGNLWFNSQYGEGSTFTFAIKLNQNENFKSFKEISIGKKEQFKADSNKLVFAWKPQQNLLNEVKYFNDINKKR